MKKTLATLMVLAFGLGASTSFAQNAEPAPMPAPIPAPMNHSMKMQTPEAHQAVPAPHVQRMQAEPNHKPAAKKHRKPKHRMHLPM